MGLSMITWEIDHGWEEGTSTTPDWFVITRSRATYSPCVWRLSYFRYNTKGRHPGANRVCVSETCALEASTPDKKSRGCYRRNSRPTMINPDNNMTKQPCIKHLWIRQKAFKISTKSSDVAFLPTFTVTSPSCLHLLYLSLVTAVAAFYKATVQMKWQEITWWRNQIETFSCY